MKRPAALLCCLLPALAAAQLRNTRHDLSATSTSAIRATSETQLCIFCHVPHHASQTRLLWNKPDVSGTRGWASGSATTVGTPLPSEITPDSKRCLSCHDGTIALGSVVSSGGANPIAMTADAPSSGYLVGNGPAGDELNGSHPVSIPFAGQTYNGIPSSADVTKYWAVSTSGCLSPSGICTSQATDGRYISLRGTAPGGAGIECTSCHEIHNKYSANAFFLRVTDQNSRLCMACHNN